MTARTKSIPKSRLGLWVCFLVAWLAALYFHQQRWHQESRNRSTEMVLDFNSLVELSRARGQEWQAVLPEFTPLGVTALAFSELRLDELEHYGICKNYSGVDLGADTGLGSGPAPLPNPQFTYVVQWGVTKNPLMDSAQLEAALAQAFGRDKVRRYPLAIPGSRYERSTIFEVGLPLRSVQVTGICFPDWAIGQIGKLRIWLRPENKPPVTSQGIRDYLGRLQKAYKVEGIVFGGSSNEVLGYPDELETTAACLQEFGWKLGFIELPKTVQQKGIESLIRQLPNQTVRVFAVPPQHQATLKPPRVAQMHGLASRERNLRVLYLRPYAYDPTPDKGFEDANSRLFGLIQQDLKDRLGPAGVFGNNVVVPPWGLALLSLGGLSAFWLMLTNYVRVGAPLWVTSLVIFAVMNAVVPATPVGHLWLALMALGTSCCCAGLAVVSQFPALRLAAQSPTWLGVMLGSTRCWLGMSLISLLGAWIASCFLQATSYKLGLDIFRGVKFLTVLMPVLIAGAWMLSRDERKHWLSIGVAPLRLYQLIALAVLAVGGVIYTMRTGNMAGDAGGDALEMERIVRMVLDQTLGVRPRFKEFLLAHPAMLLVPFLVRWGWREAAAVFIMIGAVGQCGIFDTFAHVHTPLQISLIRCLLGLLLGALFGWLLGGILWQLEKGLSWVRTRLSIST